MINDSGVLHILYRFITEIRDKKSYVVHRMKTLEVHVCVLFCVNDYICNIKNNKWS